MRIRINFVLKVTLAIFIAIMLMYLTDNKGYSSEIIAVKKDDMLLNQNWDVDFNHNKDDLYNKDPDFYNKRITGYYKKSSEETVDADIGVYRFDIHDDITYIHRKRHKAKGGLFLNDTDITFNGLLAKLDQHTQEIATIPDIMYAFVDVLVKQEEFTLPQCSDRRAHEDIVYIKNHKCASDSTSAMLRRFALSRNLSVLLPIGKKYGLGFPFQMTSSMYCFICFCVYNLLTKTTP